MRLQVISVQGRKRRHAWWNGELGAVCSALRTSQTQNNESYTFLVQDSESRTLATIMPMPSEPGLYVTTTLDGLVIRHLVYLVDDVDPAEQTYEEIDVDCDTYSTITHVRRDFAKKGGCIIV